MIPSPPSVSRPASEKPKILGFEVIEDDGVPPGEAWIAQRPRYTVYIEDCRVVVERVLPVVAKIVGLSEQGQ